MYLDAQLLVSDAQALSATGFSTNTIDLLAATNDISVGEPLAFNVSVDVAADATTGDETYTFQVVQSANANLSSPDVLVQEAISRATLVAGYAFQIPIPPGSITKRYLGLQYTLGGTTPSITCTAWLAPLNQMNRPKTYPKGYTISG